MGNVRGFRGQHIKSLQIENKTITSVQGRPSQMQVDAGVCRWTQVGEEGRRRTQVGVGVGRWTLLVESGWKYPLCCKHLWFSESETLSSHFSSEKKWNIPRCVFWLELNAAFSLLLQQRKSGADPFSNRANPLFLIEFPANPTQKCTNSPGHFPFWIFGYLYQYAITLR